MGVQVAALDSFSGQLIKRWAFNNDPAQAPVNMALGAGGTLVYTLPDRICGKNLNEPGAEANWEVAAQSPGLPLYTGMTGPDQLVIDEGSMPEGRILALCNAAREPGQSVYVRVHSLETGRAIRSKAPDGKQEIETLLASTAKAGAGVSLRTAGPYLYVLGPQSLVSYDLERQLRGADPNPPAGARRVYPDSQIREAYIGSDHLVLLDEVGWNPGFNANNRPPTSCRLLAYWRGQTENGESGLLNHDPIVMSEAGIVQWQPVQGGFYYRTKDRKLHFLHGARR
jgi:hypothetical protein